MVKVVHGLVVGCLFIAMLVGCVPYSAPPPPTPKIPPPSPPSPLPPPVSPSSPTSTPPSPAEPSSPSQPANPPMNLTIDYIGIKSAYDEGDPYDRYSSEVKLVVLVSDGQEKSTPQLIPPTEYLNMRDFHVEELKQRVFYTPSVGDYLHVCILAYDVDPNTETLNLLSAFEKLGQSAAGALRMIVDSLPKESLVGYYESTWYAADNWGVGHHDAVGVGNFRVWLRIWSNQEPPPSPTPPSQPDVKIDRVVLPSTVSLGYIGLKNVNHTLVLTNNENTDVTIDYFGDSDLAKELYRSPVKGKAEVPRRGSIELPHQFQYSKAGTNTVTYIIKYDGKQLSRWSGKVTVTP